MRIENTFEVAATLGEAWALLTDVPRVVPCMPGAEIERTIDESAWTILQRVKLGPISLQFRSELRRTVLDETNRRAVLAVNAREARGRGGAEATIESTLEPVGDGTRVSVVTELELRGTVAQYGRPVVGSVAEDLTARFADCLAGLLENETASTPPDPVQAVGGLRLVLGSLWRRLSGRG
jgi:carbon monoxide dehydrogenase subunit G